MIQSNELRLGNYIGSLNDINEPAKICYVGEYDFGYERLSDGEYFQGNSIKPIPLNEEWLLKLGAINGEGMFYLDELELIIYKSHIAIYSLGIKIKYVHQLQNLIFALTDKELTTQ